MCATELISPYSTEAWSGAEKKGTNQRGRRQGCNHLAFAISGTPAEIYAVGVR